MIEMFDENMLNSYMIQVRMQSITDSLGQMGYANEMVIENPGEKKICFTLPEKEGSFEAHYEIIFDEDNSQATGFIMSLYYLEDGQNKKGEPVATRQEPLELDSDETAQWIVQHALNL